MNTPTTPPFQVSETRRATLESRSNKTGSHDNPGPNIGAGLMHIGDALNNIARAIAHGK